MSSERVGRLGILGGTFDPPHIGHLRVASEVMDALSLDRVILLPAGTPWQKSGYTAAEDRLMMVILASTDRPGLAVSRLEIDRRGPTYTIDTLVAMKAAHPDSDLYFIGGTDTFANAMTWDRFDRIAELAIFAMVGRPGTETASLPIDDSWPEVVAVDMEPVDVSATLIRQRVRDGLSIDELVPPAVASYIRDRGLYVGTEERAS